MADIRIKDLTTLESASLTGDVFVIDGTTGTRKLSAFSPTFGGNATVTGTLTVNGTGSSSVATTTPFAVSTGITVASGGFGVGAVGTGGSFFVNTPSASSGFSSGLAIDGSYPGGIGSQSVINIKAFGVMSGGGYGSTLSFQTTLNGTFNEVMRMTSDKQVSILGTNASTTTSTGALVVGNGTSGGLGVGGAIFAGDSVTIPNAKNFVVRNAAGSSTGMRMYADSSDYGYIDCTANTELRLQVGAGTKLSITNTGNVSIPATTASTTTSSGALVVSGGVGVAGAIFAGGAICGPNGSTSTPTFSFASDTSSGIYSLGTKKLGIAVNANIAVAVQADVDGSTGPTVYIKDLATAPTANPTGGGYLYVQGGALKYRGSSGTVTNIANA